MTCSKLKVFWASLFVFIAQSAAQGLPPKIIVKYKETVSKDEPKTVLSSFKAGTQVDEDGQQIKVQFSKGTQQADIQKAIQDFEKDPNVEYAEEDIVMQAFYEPGDEGREFEDTKYRQQWSLFDPKAGIEMPLAWDHTRGSSSQVIAVVDTGMTVHPDFENKVLRGGDMISDLRVANDGDARDTDASDPGDWVGPGDPCYSGNERDSSWHGTHVAGIAAAVGGNGQGVAGVSFGARILPVRVLGKCGGYSSDIAAGIRWAAGADVSGLPRNSNPAKVINLSLGGRGACGATMQSAVDEAIARGSLVVVAAGNEFSDLDFTQVTPANCDGVLTVGATNRYAKRANYSNFGRAVDVMAPGGEGGFQNAILSTYNSGSKRPGSPSFSFLSGTSMAAPHVAGAASLVFSLYPNLFPLQVKEMIQQSARFISCPERECGGGLLDVENLLAQAKRSTPDPRFEGREPIRDDGAKDSSNFQNSSTGGGCGSIDMQGPGGPGRGGPMILGLMFLFMAMGQKFKSRLI